MRIWMRACKFDYCSGGWCVWMPVSPAAGSYVREAMVLSIQLSGNRSGILTSRCLVNPLFISFPEGSWVSTECNRMHQNAEEVWTGCCSLVPRQASHQYLILNLLINFNNDLVMFIIAILYINFIFIFPLEINCNTFMVSIIVFWT